MNFLTKNPIFFRGGCVFFYKLTRNPNLTFFFFGGGGGGGGEKVVYVHEQLFQMALLLFNENTCANLF